MPWELKKGDDGKWHVYNQETGKDEGASESRAMALAHLRALYATSSEYGSDGKKGGKKW